MPDEPNHDDLLELSETAEPGLFGDNAIEQAIGNEVRRLRQSKNQSMADVARRAGISTAMMSRIENAQTSCSLSTLGRLASAFEVPIATFFRGVRGPRDAVYTAAGQGSRTYGRDGRGTREYEHLGMVPGARETLNSMIVTLNDPQDTSFAIGRRSGTHLIYMLEGVMIYQHGAVEYRLRPGDSLLMDGDGWYGVHELVRWPVRYLSVNTPGDTE
jgi:transcriptional regulator with XRE-family HTH domain